jgi:hypothetical protein
MPVLQHISGLKLSFYSIYAAASDDETGTARREDVTVTLKVTVTSKQDIYDNYLYY